MGEHRVAIVTGGGRGIGLASAKALAGEGASVVIAEIDQDLARDAAAELTDLGATAMPYITDVSRRESVEEMVQATLDRFGQIDVLVNNAAIHLLATVLEMQEQQWDSILNVGLKGVFLCSQAVGRHMTARRSGSVVNIASVASQRGVRGRGSYVVTKAGVIALTRVLAMEWASAGVRVNAVAPGFVDTELFRRAVHGATDYQSMIERITPLGRIANAAEIAAVVAFLASERASYITGETVFADGGLLAAAQWENLWETNALPAKKGSSRRRQ